MKAGDLVKITRRAIGVPPGTIGLILKSTMQSALNENGLDSWVTHTVEMYFPNKLRLSKPRRWLEQDLEVISESR